VLAEDRITVWRSSPWHAYYDSAAAAGHCLLRARAGAESHDPDILTDLGTCYRNSGNPDRALQFYQKALTRTRALNARYNLGIVYAYDRKDLAALSGSGNLLRIAPTFPMPQQ